MILASLLTGKPGSYKVFGFRVKFEKKTTFDTSMNYGRIFFVGHVARFCMQSRVFRYITLSYLHVFVHEMGHALAHKILTGKFTTITVFQDTCTGMNESNSNRPLPKWKNSIIFAAGPVVSVAFSSLKLIAATALVSQVSPPVACVVGAGAVVWMTGELLYAAISSLEGKGDFGAIARISDAHFCLATLTLITECALGIFFAIKLAA
jgi:hypothetical protein